LNSSREKSFDTSRTIQYDTELSRHTLAHMPLVPIHPPLYSITHVWIGTSNCRLFRQFLNNICRRLLTTEVTSMRRDSIKVLTERGWTLCIDSEDSRSKVIVPTWPVSVEAAIAALVADDKESVAFLGQWIMWGWLDVLVDALDYLDNSRPDWLRNADTGYRMELDREYRSLGVAFEFQGEQHFRPTEAYPDEDVLARQQLRDDQKAGVCLRNGVRLVEVTFEDLTLRRMLKKVDGLPLRHYRPDGPIIRTLSQYSDSYIAWMRRRKAGAK